MMIGETHRHVPPWQESPTNPTVQITQSSPPSQLSLQSNGPNQLPNSPTYYDAVLASLRRYLNATKDYDHDDDDDDFVAQDYDDDFFMYDFKVRKCVRARPHDWTECPFAHPGEKARRRDPRKYNYSGTSCSEFRKGGCKKGDACEFAHGVFECWLHPARFRTQACKDGPDCKRWVCFFAHTPDELRTVQGLGSPRGRCLLESKDEVINPAGVGVRVGAANSPKIGELAAKLQNLQLNKVKFMPTTWGTTTHHASQHVGGSPTTTCNMGGSMIYGSPRSVVGSSSMNRTGFFSLPTTPTQSRIGYWDNMDFGYDMGDLVMERIESGRELRVKMFEKLSKENPLNVSDTPLFFSTPRPDLDFGWVSDLIE